MVLVWFAHLLFQRKNKQSYNLINGWNVNLTAYTIYYRFIWHTNQKLRLNSYLLTHFHNFYRNEFLNFFRKKIFLSLPSKTNKQTNKTLEFHLFERYVIFYVEDIFACMAQISTFGQALESKNYTFNVIVWIVWIN